VLHAENKRYAKHGHEAKVLSYLDIYDNAEYEVVKLSRQSKLLDILWHRLFNPFLPGIYKPTQSELLRRVQDYDPDIILVHWIHRNDALYIPLQALKRMATIAHIFLILHDLWFITGRCYYPDDCERLITGCGHCPQFNSFRDIKIDVTSHLCKLKVKYYDNIKPIFIASSKWSQNLALTGSPFSKFDVKHVPRGINTEIFHKMDKNMAKKILGIPHDKKVILVSARNMLSPRKGTQYAVRTLNELWTRHPDICQSTVLVTLGRSADQLFENQPFPRITIGQLEYDSLMALCYSASDVFLNTSLGETFGLMTAEAMACGVPVVAFDNTAMPELVKHLETGYLCRNRNIDDMTDGLYHILSDVTLQEKLSNNCCLLIKEKHDIELQVKNYLKLFEAVLEKKSTY